MSAFTKLQVKTQKEVHSPLSKIALDICMKYKKDNKEAFVFPTIDNQVMNRYLKIIAKNAKITKNITTHVARHTFGTLLGASGIASAFMISKLMGHSDLTMTQTYINLSNEDAKDTMNKFWNNQQ